MITAKGRFAQATFDGVNVVIERRESLLGTKTVTLPAREITGMIEGRSSFGERYVRFVLPGAEAPRSAGRSDMARDPFVILFWKRHGRAFAQLIAAVNTVRSGRPYVG